MLLSTLFAVAALSPIPSAPAMAPAPQGYSAAPSGRSAPVGGTPEPTTLMLLCGGALAYAACRRYARPQRRED